MRPGRRHPGHPRLIGLLLAVALCAPASAQDRGPASHKTLLDLAYVLGQAHALRQACAPDDPMWRARMQRMLEIEAPDQAFENELAERFNAGFGQSRTLYPRCDARVPAAEAKVAAEGRRLSQALSRTP